MNDEERTLLQQIKDDINATSIRQHRDARRQHTLRAASVALGTGLSAAVVSAKLRDAGLALRPVQPQRTAEEFRTSVVEAVHRFAEGVAKTRPGYDGYRR